jgi:hypothetical protein
MRFKRRELEAGQKKIKIRRLLKLLMMEETRGEVTRVAERGRVYLAGRSRRPGRLLRLLLILLRPLLDNKRASSALEEAGCLL